MGLKAELQSVRAMIKKFAKAFAETGLQRDSRDSSGSASDKATIVRRRDSKRMAKEVESRQRCWTYWT